VLNEFCFRKKHHSVVFSVFPFLTFAPVTKNEVMFGIDQITWRAFTEFVLLVLLAWYGVLIILGRIKSKHGNRHVNYEEYQSGITSFETLQPITVSSQDYPSEILPVNPVSNLSLPASLYEETCYDEGLAIEHFTEKNSPLLAKMITEIHYQQ